MVCLGVTMKAMRTRIAWLAALVGSYAFTGCHVPNTHPKPTLEEQEKCSRRAEALFTEAKGGRDSLVDLQNNHYNPTIGICSAKISFVDKFGQYIQLWNAFESRTLGEYMALDQTKGPPNVSLCYVETPQGKQTCQSKDEFENLVKIYTEN